MFTIAGAQFLGEMANGLWKSTVSRTRHSNLDGHTTSPALIIPASRAMYSRESVWITRATTSPSSPARPGLNKWATRCVACANSLYVTHSVPSGDADEGNIAQGLSGLCVAWKSTKPGNTVMEPSMGGCGTVLGAAMPLQGMSRQAEPKVREYIYICRIAWFLELLFCTRRTSAMRLTVEPQKGAGTRIVARRQDGRWCARDAEAGLLRMLDGLVPVNEMSSDK